jgi:hypothetical protein
MAKYGTADGFDDHGRFEEERRKEKIRLRASLRNGTALGRPRRTKYNGDEGGERTKENKSQYGKLRYCKVYLR